MNNTSATNPATGMQRSQQMKAQFASYLKGQTENMRSFHRVMKVSESVGFGIIILVFAVALAFSFMWKTISMAAIPAAWLLLPVSFTILLLLTCVHAIVLGAFPPTGTFSIALRGFPVHLPRKNMGFVTGNRARLLASGLIVVSLVVGAFFAIFAWAAWTVNWALLVPMINILGTLMGFGIAAGILVGILTSIYQKIFKPR